MNKNKIEISYDPEHPCPHQKILAEEKCTTNTETGEIISRVKTGRVFPRKYWYKLGWRFPRWGRTVSWQ